MADPPKMKWADMEDDDDDLKPLPTKPKQRWADMDDADDGPAFPSRKMLIGTSNGVKTYQEYVHKNQIAYRVTTKYKTKRVVKKSNLYTRERLGWAPFGFWVNNDEESGKPQPAEEEVRIEVSKDSQLKEVGQEEKFWEESVLLCESFLNEAKKKKRVYDISALRQRRELEEQQATMLAQQQGGAPGGLGSGPQGSGPPATGNRYVPPSMRNSAMGGGMGGDKKNVADNTLRVTNLADDCREGDLQLLFGKIGQVERVFMPKYKEGEKEGQHKGFAFVQFRTATDANNAIKRLNGYGFDNLILSVMWAAPRNV